MKWVLRESGRQLKKLLEHRKNRPAKQTPPVKTFENSMEMEKLLRELRESHIAWKCAQKRLDYALEEEEIDYAIFALETAEKRYGMLLRQAKAWNVTGTGVHGISVQGSSARSIGG